MTAMHFMKTRSSCKTTSDWNGNVIRDGEAREMEKASINFPPVFNINFVILWCLIGECVFDTTAIQSLPRYFATVLLHWHQLGRSNLHQDQQESHNRDKPVRNRTCGGETTNTARYEASKKVRSIRWGILKVDTKGEYPSQLTVL